MGTLKRVDIYVPEEIYEKICQDVYTRKYEFDPKTAIILSVLRANTTTSLKSIVWLLEKDHKIIVRRTSRLKQIAEQCGIDYTP